MGGLAGLIHFRGDPPDPEIAKRMSVSLKRRGPDGFGAFNDGPVALTHRLRRVAASQSVQPLVKSDVVVMLDGWIYDHEALSRRAGSDVPAVNDVGALVHAWRRWGLDFSQHVDGDFAIAIWDRRSKTLCLCRDRLGVRPLFWAREGERFAFASQLPALLEVPWVSRDIQLENLAEYLTFRVVHAPRTLLRVVHQVEPAHWLQVNADRLRARRYWYPNYAAVDAPIPNETEVVDALQEAVQRSVRRRLRGGAETGIFLSGGLGSTAIAAAARNLYKQLPSFTISFADDPNPESPFAGRVARLLNTEHHEIVMGSAELASTYEPCMQSMGQPIGNPACVLQLTLARAAAARVRVVLSGDGGEELFGGRMLTGLARSMRLARLFARLPRPVQRLWARALIRRPSGRRIVTPLDRYGLELGLGGANIFGTDERRSLLRDPALVRPHVRHDVLEPFYANLYTDPINAILHAYLRSWLGEGSLTRADRTAAAAGLDVRFPLLDREVVQRAAALPGSFKLRRVGGSLHTRWLLRSILSGVLPPVLVNRPKRGMPTPLEHWLAGPGRLFMESRFAKLKKDERRLWNIDYLERLRYGVGHHQRECGLQLWTLFNLDAWLDSL